MNEGEPITNAELDKYLQLLCGDDVSKALKPAISADEFAENILGFEEVDEEEEEGALEEGQQNDQQAFDSRGMGVIPEEAGF
jgi:hypothetical protein